MVRLTWLSLATLAMFATTQSYAAQRFQNHRTGRYLRSGITREVQTIKGIDLRTSWRTNKYGSYRELKHTFVYTDFGRSYCLDSNASKHVYLNPCGKGRNRYQLWKVVHRSNGTISLQNKATGLCLDSNANGRVYTNKCSPTNAYQQWK
jgi:serine/threonine-protein kinase